MIIIRTNHDTPTNYLFEWSKSIIDEAEYRGFTVNKVEGDDITEDNLRKRIKNRQPSFIFFNGHGNKSALINNKREEFITLESADVFNSTIAFARSCECCVDLGRVG
ncbi:MAG: hypothetical protein U9M95_00390 [Candidatus Altiarchaeota archaeon]|nr:hypothetical protein [Candidatus Altiarchaeota archaeon]